MVKSYSESKKNEKMLKRYFGDQGKITNFHFTVNAGNLIPVMREIDPNAFIDEHAKELQRQIRIK